MTATGSLSSADAQFHSDALLAQWSRAKKLRDFPTLRQEGAKKGLNIVRSAGLNGSTYIAKPMKGVAALSLRQGTLEEIGAYVDSCKTVD